MSNKRHLLGPFVKPGNPVHFPALVDDPEIAHDNLYALKLVSVGTSKDGLEYIPSEHIFTEKELIRATERYYNEAEIVADGPCSSGQDQCLGYINCRTYTNKNDTLTTRFIIHFVGKNVGELNDSVYIGMFTAREIRRSADRMNWYIRNNQPWWKRIARWFYVGR